MEFTSFEPLGSSLGVLGLAGAELTEVLGCFGGGVGEEFHLQATQGLAWSSGRCQFVNGQDGMSQIVM